MKKLLLIGLSFILLIVGCENSTEPIEGCTDTNADNYNADANTNDGSCEYLPFDEYPNLRTIYGMDEYGNPTEVIGYGISNGCIENNQLIEEQDSIGYVDWYRLIITENQVNIIATCSIAGVQITLNHGSDFALTLTDGGQFSNYLTEGNTTTLIIVNPASDNLFTTSGDFTIESVIVSDVTGSSNLSSSVNMLKDYSISAAYPNPFNPTTQMSLTLNTAADVSVQVFNMNGQLIDVIANGQMAKGNYSFTWDATSAPSGVYFIKTEVGLNVHSQKIMLVK